MKQQRFTGIGDYESFVIPLQAAVCFCGGYVEAEIAFRMNTDAKNDGKFARVKKKQYFCSR